MSDQRLIIPALRPVYSGLALPVEALMRIFCGFALIVHGFPKLMNPTGPTPMVEMIGFAPAQLWAIALSICEPLSGLLLLLGLFTRLGGAMATAILVVTVYFHWVLKAEGYMGAEKSLLWMSITLFFTVRGATWLAADRAIGRTL